jgi:hypothetical protein
VDQRFSRESPPPVTGDRARPASSKRRPFQLSGPSWGVGSLPRPSRHASRVTPFAPSHRRFIGDHFGDSLEITSITFYHCRLPSAVSPSVSLPYRLLPVVFRLPCHLPSALSPSPPSPPSPVFFYCCLSSLVPPFKSRHSKMNEPQRDSAPCLPTARQPGRKIDRSPHGAWGSSVPAVDAHASV